ncbi:HDOD domain-containing protein [Litorivivens sp.]|uniref:sensor domain-containing diguanylate cyclase n=2 Tax=Litorivivens sp. TaxID=2020868 RepID=UPI00356B20A1
MSDSDIAKIMSGEAQLPTMPEIGRQLIALRSQPDITLEELVQVVSLDVALAGTLLRYANSPAHNLGATVESVERAVIIMGFKAVLDVALSLTLIKSLTEQAGPSLDYNQFWKRSLIAAVAARELGSVQREEALDELFLAALLQDIGMLALDRVKAHVYETLADGQCNHEQVCATEMASLGFDHAKFGAALLKKWGLHDRTVMAVVSSHDDQSQTEQGFLACVAASGMIADFFLAGGGKVAYQRLSKTLYRYFSIRDSQCMQLIMDIDIAINHASSLFSSIVKSTGDTRVDVAADATSISSSPRAKQPEAFVSLSRETYLDDEGELDGIMSSKAFENSLKNSFKMLRGRPISVAFLSINNLKQLEKEHGRKVASLLLRVVSRKLQEQIRIEDFVSRYGDTFALILLGSSIEDTARIVERIAELFREARYAVASGSKVALEVSAGVAGSSGELHFESETRLLEAAADALMRARNAGNYTIELQTPEHRLMALVG